MTKVLKCDCSAVSTYVSKTVTLPSSWYFQADVGVPTATLTVLKAATDYLTATLVGFNTTPGDDGIFLGDNTTSGSLNSPTSVWTQMDGGSPVASSFTADTLVTVIAHYDGTTLHWSVAGSSIISYAIAIATGSHQMRVGGYVPSEVSGEIYYVTNVKIGTTLGGVDLFQDDFASGNTSAWSSTVGLPTVIDDPFTPSPAFPDGRVLIAWDDGPLEPSPTWTRIDDPTGVTFPLNFVSGYDTSNGRQTLISQTDTGTATVYIFDRTGLLDDRNVSSTYIGKLSGRQIVLQLFNPVTSIWEPQFRGLIDDYTYDIDATAVNSSGDPINATIQIQCVDMFDYLNGYGLTPGLDGVTPPVGAEDSVYYAPTLGTVDDRILAILGNANIDSSMSLVASGNVPVQQSKYNADESALTALRDAADAELPFIANIYVDRFGRFAFRGRNSRFYPDDVAAEPGSDWDFQRWPLGGDTYLSDVTRGKMRVLSYARDRNELINAAICYPQGIAAKDIPGQVFANTSSITAYGKHSAAPMSDLIVAGSGTAFTANSECLLYAELLVKNKKDPRVSITSLELRSVNPTDAHAGPTWGAICGADISHIVNVAIGYPGGTGFTGSSPQDDYYIEGRSLTVRPANSAYDDVTVALEVSPAVWSMNLDGVFPDPF